MLLERRAQMFHHGEQPTPIPGYIDLPYVDLDGTGHFNTGDANAMTIDIKFRLLGQNGSNDYVFGKYASGNSRFSCFATRSTNVINLRLGSTAAFAVSQIDQNDHHVILNPFDLTGSFDGTHYDIGGVYENTQIRTLGIGGYRDSSPGDFAKLRVYACSAYDSNNSRIHKYEPKQRESDGVSGLYDIETDTFLTPVSA